MAYIQVGASPCNTECRSKYYVWIVPEGAKDHHKLYDCEWTKLYPMVGPGSSKIPIQSDKQCYLVTLEYMFRYGIENVRGDVYSSVTLTPEQIKEIEDIFPKPDDSCYICGEDDHQPKNCENDGKYGYGVLDIEEKHLIVRCPLCAKPFYSYRGYEAHVLKCQLRSKDYPLFQGIWRILCPIILRNNEINIRIDRSHREYILNQKKIKSSETP